MKFKVVSLAPQQTNAKSAQMTTLFKKLKVQKKIPASEKSVLKTVTPATHKTNANLAQRVSF